MNTQPTVIRKHWFGLLVILLTGGAVIALATWLMFFLYYEGTLALTFYIVLSTVLVVGSGSSPGAGMVPP